MSNITDYFGDKKNSTEYEKEKGLPNKINVDKDVVEKMIATSVGSEGNFSKNEKSKEEPLEEKEKFKLSVESTAETIGKYSKDFINNVMKSPSKFYVETSKGIMSVKEAIRKGWSPKTGDFSDDNIENMEKEKLDSLSDSDKEAVKNLFNPKNAKFKKADAEQFGLAPDSEMIEGNEAEEPAQDPNAATSPEGFSITPEMAQMFEGAKL